MKLAIVGSRGFKDTLLLESILDKYKDKVSIVISGGAIGADTMGEYWAISNKIPVKIFKPEWEKYGKSAGMRRNELIIKECDICIAFWDGKSKGTKNSIFICEKLNKKVEVITYDN
jgi:hypothetical protein